MTTNLIADTDPDLWSGIAAEIQRQEEHVELIASENLASRALMTAQGTVLTNKYSRGLINSLRDKDTNLCSEFPVYQ